MMLLLSIIFIGSLALVLPASAEVHKKIVIHVPLEVHEKHHTHTVYKHVYHKEKEHHKELESHKHKSHGKGKDSHEFVGYSYGKEKFPTWKEEEKGHWKGEEKGYWKGEEKKHLKGEEKIHWKHEEKKWPEAQWKNSHKETHSQWHGSKKNPHRISSYIPNYNHEKKREEIFEHENQHYGGHHKHKISHHGHKHSHEFDSGEDFQSYKHFDKDLKGSSSHKHFDHHHEEDDFEDDKKNVGLGITKVISHTIYHD